MASEGDGNSGGACSTDGAAPGRAGWAETGVYLHGAGTSVSDALSSLSAVAGAAARRQDAETQLPDQASMPGGAAAEGVSGGAAAAAVAGPEKHLGRLPLPHPHVRLTDGRMPARFVGIAGVYDIAKHYE